jgi:hypothetical protein
MAIDATRVATGLSQPVFAGAPPGDTSRLFIVERTGLVRILDLATNTILSTPFLDLRSQITTVGEGGLLGLAFDPNYAQNGFIYVDFTNTNDDTEIRRYQVAAGDPNRIDPASQTLILSVDQPAGLTNHKAGWLDFGPDGYLYVSLGDGGGGGDPNRNGQNPDTLLGSMLRLDVRGDAFPSDPGRNYAIPPDNPFVGVDGVRPEVWASGLRNPWRFWIDHETGSMFVADAGNARREEVDLAARGRSGLNFGWPCFEGSLPFDTAATCADAVLPLLEYPRSGDACAVIGGVVVRDGRIPALAGRYLYGDYCSGRIVAVAVEAGTVAVSGELGLVVPELTSFGVDALGRIYAMSLRGDLFRIDPRS